MEAHEDKKDLFIFFISLFPVPCALLAHSNSLINIDWMNYQCQVAYNFFID